MKGNTHFTGLSNRHLRSEVALNDREMPNRERKEKRDMEEQRHDNRSPLISLMGS